MSSIEEKLTEAIPRITAAIDQGQRRYAISELRPFFKKRIRVSAPLRSELANCLRRVELFYPALKVLRPAGLLTQDEARTKIIYALTLISIGSNREAMKILHALDLDSHPEARLALALCYFRRWDYENAIPQLEQLLLRPELLTADNILAAHTYQGVALLFDKSTLKRGLKILKQNVDQTSVTESPVRHLNCLFFSCIGLLLDGQLKQVEHYLLKLARSNSSVPDAAAVNEQHIVESFLALLRASLSERAAARRAIQKLRNNLLGQELHYRAILVDYLLGFFTTDTQILERLYVGSGFPKLRELITPLLPKEPQTYRHKLIGDDTSKTVFVLDLGENTIVGRSPHRALLALASSFYRGLSLLELHEAIFETKDFQVSSSPAKVKQTLSRLRHWLAQKRIPLEIVAQKGLYTLQAKRPVELLIPVQTNPQKSALSMRHLLLLRKIEKSFGTKTFDTHAVAKLFSISPSTAQRTILACVKSGALKKLSDGPQTAYHLA